MLLNNWATSFVFRKYLLNYLNSFSWRLRSFSSK